MLDGKGKFLVGVGNVEHEVTGANDDRGLNCPVFNRFYVGGAKSRDGKEGDGIRHFEREKGWNCKGW